jgi:hypothetical protein
MVLLVKMEFVEKLVSLEEWLLVRQLDFSLEKCPGTTR